MILAFILIVLYVNLIRFQELTCNTSMWRLKEYFNTPTYIYNFTLLLIWVEVWILKITTI